jgi:hypothetical protein
MLIITLIQKLPLLMLALITWRAVKVGQTQRGLYSLWWCAVVTAVVSERYFG